MTSTSQSCVQTGWPCFISRVPHLCHSRMKKIINMKQDRLSFSCLVCGKLGVKEDCIYTECCAHSTAISKKEITEETATLNTHASDNSSFGIRTVIKQSGTSNARQWQNHQLITLTTRRRFVFWGENDKAKSFILLPLQTDIIDLWGLLVCKLYPI